MNIKADKMHCPTEAIVPKTPADITNLHSAEYFTLNNNVWKNRYAFTASIGIQTVRSRQVKCISLKDHQQVQTPVKADVLVIPAQCQGGKTSDINDLREAAAVAHHSGKA